MVVGHALPHVGVVVGGVIFAPRAADVGRRSVAPRGLGGWLRRRLASVAQIGFPEFGAVVDVGLPTALLGAGLGRAGNVPARVLVYVLLKPSKHLPSIPAVSCYYIIHLHNFE